MDLGFSPVVFKKLFYISAVLLSAVVVSAVIKSFIKVPKSIQGRRQATYASVLKNIISIVVYVIALNIILGILEINIAPVLASAGIIGLSIGLGAKALIEDLIAGVSLLSQDSVAIGDHVEIDGSIGTIEKMGFRTLDIRATDGSLHIIPNGMVKKVINHSRNPKGYKQQASVKSKK